ncbi:flagellar protein FliO/FliZ [Natronocella acetinitrilica]|uniref:Flagellar protein n=1 Tax=Natronocella acetinitrilica TaxID=414046 RepID=A0AAE3G6F0_9GAMM|nr:flagellar biosynthetic protein FliO [Natronocella acetinitrilica]MCP1675596.1 flagellar protein FliO/FliZ [Natronocella acetinitrilica]
MIAIPRSLSPSVRQAFVGAVVLGVGFLAPIAAMAQDSGASPGLDSAALIRVSLGLVAVLAAIVALGWIVRRMGNVAGSAAGRMRVLGGVSVGNRERVVLLQVGDQQILLGVAPGRVQTLHVLDQPLEVSGSDTGAGRGRDEQQGFASRLHQVMAQNRPSRKDPSS